MRLNCVESFYAFLLHFHSKGSPYKGQPGMAMASPIAGVATYSGNNPEGTNDYRQQPGRKGLLPTTRPQGGVANCSQDPPARGRLAAAMPLARGGHPKWQQPRRHERLCLARKELPPAARPPRGLAPRPGLSPAREVPPEGSNAYRGGATHADGVQRRHLRRPAATVAAQMGAR
ncbi:hypothetical protein BHE74_00019133 [Ensete ventricosum]|nr:hypothetical protein BHE74_00019133 [Ensete ventricosum]